MTYAPIFQGRIPFPSQLVTNFPPWASIPRTIEAPQFPGETGDLVTLFYPWRYFQATAFAEGELPLWNPRILSGSPFLGNAQSALFYPLHIIFYFLPVPAAWTVKLVVNVALGGLMTALFVRSIGGGIPGAIAAGVVFALGGMMTTWQGTSITDTAVWLPFMCLAVHRLCSLGGGARAVALTATAFALPILAGHPPTAAHIILTGCAFAVWQSVFSSPSWTAGSRRLMLFGFAGLLAIGLASIQIFPTAEWVGQTDRTIEHRWGNREAQDWVSFLSRDITSNPNSSGLEVPEVIAYAGLLTLFAAPFALLHASRRECLFFLFAAVGAVLIIFGWAPAYWLIEQIPIIRGLKNWRLLLLVDFSLAVLAGLGISVLSEEVRRTRSARTYIAIALALCFALAVWGVGLLQMMKHSDAHWLEAPISSAVLLVAGGLLVVLWVESWIGPRMFSGAAVGLISLDLITFAYGFLPFTFPRYVFPDVPFTQFLKTHDPWQGRVASMNFTYGPNFEMMYGLHSTGGYDLTLRSFTRFVEDLSAPSLGQIVLDARKILDSADRRIDLLNTKYLVTTSDNGTSEMLASRPDRFSLRFREGKVQIFENRSALPRAFFVAARENAIEVLSDEQAQLDRVKDPSFDPERSVVLPAFPAGIRQFKSERPPPSVQWMKTSSNEIHIQVTTDNDGVLVLSQVFYPGWKVFVDDADAEIMRADYALTAVAVRAGTHLVKFIYRPASFAIGGMISLLSLVVLIVLFTRHS